MIQVYVTKKPQKATECPFYNENNKKCAMTKGACCFETKTECNHLVTLEFDFGIVPEGETE